MSSADFDWQTEEEEIEMVTAPVAEPMVRRRWSWRLLVGILLLATAVYGGFRWRTARQTAAITNDVLASHTLLQEAKTAEDVEMLNVVLSGRDLGWQEAQQRLMSDGNFANRPGFGLQALATSEAEPDVVLSPDLAEAVVVSPQSFQADAGEAVTLQETAVYRQGARNWLLAPPTDDFWGQTIVTTTTYFTVTYPQRDEALVQRLTADLNTLFAERICDRLLQCGQLHAALHFSTTPQSLVTTADPLGLLLMGNPIILPTPTLVGLPVDEAGYEVLFKGYGAQVVTAVVAHLFEYECCRSASMTYALLSKQASELGLSTWPLTPAAYDHLLNFTFGTQKAWEILEGENIASAAERERAYALVDFLAAETAWNPVQLQASLWQGNTSLSLRQLVDEERFMDRWLDFVYKQTADGRSVPAAPLPPAIDLACAGPLGAVLYTYDLATGQRTATPPVNPPFGGSTRIWPLPQGQGQIVNEEIYRRFELEARLSLRYEGEEHILLQQILTELYPLSEYSFAGQTDPNGRYVLLLSQARSSRNFSRQYLLDLENCKVGQCRVQALAGRPVWSPDGTRTLVVALPNPAGDNNEVWQLPISLGDGAAQVETAVGEGYDPEWLDDTTYSYLRRNSQNESEWVTADIDDNVPEVQLAADELRTAMPTTEQPEQLFMQNMIVAAPQQIAIIATTNTLTDSLDYLFLWDRVNTPQFMQTGTGLHVEFSPDGRWLTITATDGTVILLDTTTQMQQQFNSPTMRPDWSADSQWLLTGREGYLLLTTPDTGYQQIIPSDLSACHQVTWGVP